MLLELKPDFHFRMNPEQVEKGCFGDLRALRHLCEKMTPKMIHEMRELLVIGADSESNSPAEL